jgi:hypothetical protein
MHAAACAAGLPDHARSPIADTYEPIDARSTRMMTMSR